MQEARMKNFCEYASYREALQGLADDFLAALLRSATSALSSASSTPRK